MRKPAAIQTTYSRTNKWVRRNKREFGCFSLLCALKYIVLSRGSCFGMYIVAAIRRPCADGDVSQFVLLHCEAVPVSRAISIGIGIHAVVCLRSCKEKCKYAHIYTPAHAHTRTHKTLRNKSISDRQEVFAYFGTCSRAILSMFELLGQRSTRWSGLVRVSSSTKSLSTLLRMAGGPVLGGSAGRSRCEAGLSKTLIVEKSKLGGRIESRCRDCGLEPPFILPGL